MTSTQRLFCITSGHFPSMKGSLPCQVLWQRQQLAPFEGERLCTNSSFLVQSIISAVDVIVHF